MNQDETYEGPQMIITAPIGMAPIIDLSHGPNTKVPLEVPGGDKGEGGVRGVGIRIIKVYENESFQEFYTIKDVPKTIVL